MLNDLAKIFKTRLPEIFLITGFFTIAFFLSEQLSAASPTAVTPAPLTMTQTTNFIYSMTVMIFMVFATMFHLGFMATLNVNPTEPHSPAVLISIGKIFFWRTVRFQLLAVLYLLALIFLIMAPIKLIFFRSTETANIPEWTVHLSSIVAMILLIKPLTLILPIMITRNLMVFSAIRVLSEYKLSKILILPLIFIGGIVIINAITAIQQIMPSNTTLFNIVYAVKSIITAFTALLTGMIGIWFIGGKKFGSLHPPEEEPQEEPEHDNPPIM